MNVLENNICPLQKKLVDDIGHRLLIARNRMRRENNGVAGSDLHLPVLIFRHSGQRGHALTLRAGRNDRCFLRRIIAELFLLDQCVLRYVQTSDRTGRRNDVHHAASLDGNLASVLVGGIDDLLHTVDIGRKGRNDNPRILMLGKNPVDGHTDGFLRLCIARALCVGGVTHQCQNSVLSKLRETLQINGISVNRSVIHLKISGVYHDSHRGIDGKCSGIHNAVVGFDEFHAEASEVYRLPEGNDNPLRGIHHFVLSQLVLNQCNGQSGSVYRDIYLLQNVRKCSDVILMSMRNDKALDLVDVVLQIRDIRYHAVNTEHIVLGECQTAVHHNNTVFVFEGSDVHSDLLQAAERNNLQSRAGELCFFLIRFCCFCCFRCFRCILLFRQFVPVLSYGSPYIPEESRWLRSDPDTACGAVAGSPFWRAFHPLPP